MTRKLFAGLVSTILFVFIVAGSAFATQGDSTYLDAGGVSPHGGYQVASKKCGVCHAVHHAGDDGAGGGSQALLRSSRADACTYCHISPGVSSKIVYGGVQGNYDSADLGNAHNDPVIQCSGIFGCHQVHAAASLMTSNAALTAAIIQKAPLESDYDVEAGPPGALDAKDLAITKWCTRCHQYWPGTGLDAVDSHILTAPPSGTYAFSASSYCVSCHNSNTVGSVVPTGSAFPHYTDGARFLTSSLTSAGGSAGATAVADSQFDGVCLRCHRNGSGIGIGMTF